MLSWRMCGPLARVSPIWLDVVGRAPARSSWNDLVFRFVKPLNRITASLTAAYQSGRPSAFLGAAGSSQLFSEVAATCPLQRDRRKYLFIRAPAAKHAVEHRGGAHFSTC